MTELSPRWEHQQKAFDFAMDLFRRKQHGAMLAMVMGAGKSRVACELATAQDARTVLVVCPLRVVDVWQAQFARFAPAYHFVALGANVPSVTAKAAEIRRMVAWSDLQQPRGRPLVICINYDSARMAPAANYIAARQWDMTIADESHRLKSPTGRASIFMAKVGLVSTRRIALTGTPMPHMPIDIWAQFRFMNPYHLERTFFEHKLKYAVMGGYFNKKIVDWRNLDDLERRFRELAFRVDESVLDLPEEMDEIRSTSLSEKGQRIYDEMEEEMIAWINESQFVTSANAMVKLTRLQQITSGWAPDQQGTLLQCDHAKEDLLEEILEDLREPVVVFCRFKSDLVAAHRVAAKIETGLGSILGPHSHELSGDRNELAQWQKPDAPLVLAVQIKAGGVGVDLTRARVAIFYSIGFELADYLQARGRIRRPPQARPCLFIHLQARDSVDKYVLAAVEARQDLVDRTLNELKTKRRKNVLAG